jgi:O-antigen/teichoic acid export membrane protein
MNSRTTVSLEKRAQRQLMPGLRNSDPTMNAIFKPALILMVGRTFGFVVAFCLPVVLVRVFDPAGFGTYKQLFLIYGTLFGIAQLGMAESLYYFLPNASQNGGRYVLNAALALAIAGCLCVGVLAGARTTISSWMGNSHLAPLLPFLGVFLLLTLPAATLEITMIARQRYPWASWSYVLSDLARATFCLIPVLVLPTLEVLLLGVIAFALLRLGAAWWYLQDEFDGTLRPDLGVLKQQLRYALPFEMAVLVEIVQANFHQYAVSYRFDAATFAIYAVGCLQIPVLDLVSTSTCTVMMVQMAELIHAGRGHAVVALWHDTTRKLALIFFPLVGLLLVNARELIVLLYTENYLASVPIFMVSCLFILLAVFQIDGVLRVYAQTRFLFVLNVTRLLVIVAFMQWFLSTLHLLGAVLITVLAAAIGRGLGLARMKRLMEVGLTDLLPWSSLAAIGGVAAIAGVPALIVKSSAGLPTLPLLVTTSLVYTASFLALAIGFRVFRDTELAVITSWLRWRIVGPSKA